MPLVSPVAKPVVAGIVNFTKNSEYKYEVCDNNDECKYVAIDKIVEPSEETFYVCNKEFTKIFS